MLRILPIEQERGSLHEETNSKTNEELGSLLEEMRVNWDLCLQQKTKIMKCLPPCPPALPSFLPSFLLCPSLPPSLPPFFSFFPFLSFFNLPITHSTCSPYMSKTVMDIQIDIILLKNGDLCGMCLSEFCFLSHGAIYFQHQNFPNI